MNDVQKNAIREADNYLKAAGLPTYSALTQLHAAQAGWIAELEGRVHTCGPTCSKAGCINRRLTAERDQLRADVERSRPNAERWEWIADGNNFDESFALLTDPKLTTQELTRAVDAARTTQKTNHEQHYPSN